MNFNQLDQFLKNMEKDYSTPDCCLRITYNHETVFSQDYVKEANNKYFYLFSATKPVTCTGALRLIERGKLALEDTVGRYIPEFANVRVMKNGSLVPAERKMTIKDLFTMCGGLNYDLNMPSILEEKKKNPNASTLDLVRALAKEPLSFEPSTQFQYSLCHDVLAGVVEIVSGMSFGEYQKKNIFEPLGMTDTGFTVTDKILAQMYPQYRWDEEQGVIGEIPKVCEYIMTPRYESGGAGLISTADDYIKFADTMGNYGVSADGYVLLKKETIDLMRTNSVPEELLPTAPGFERGYGYGLGVRTMIDPQKCNAKSPVGEFGWDGAGGAFTLFDVDHSLAVFYIQHVRNHGWACGVTHYIMRDLIYDALGLSN